AITWLSSCSPTDARPLRAGNLPFVLASHHSDLSSQDRHLGPRPRGLWFGREFCEQGTPWRQPPRLPAACCSRSAAVPRTQAPAARAATPAAGPTGPPPPPSPPGVA